MPVWLPPPPDRLQRTFTTVWVGWMYAAALVGFAGGIMFGVILGHFV